MTERSLQPWEEEAARQWELRVKREEWEQQRKLQREQEERQRKQAALKEYLDLRSGMYLDHTSQSPTQTQLERWAEEFISAQVRRTQEDREARLTKSIDENYDFGEEVKPYEP
jgi:hypothetical protein